MGLVVWTMMAIAVWHFTVFVPDRFLGGIVGAFVASIAGALLLALVANGFAVPGRSETDLAQALLALPGSLVGLAVCWLWGDRRERRAASG